MVHLVNRVLSAKVSPRRVQLVEQFRVFWATKSDRTQPKMAAKASILNIEFC